MNGKSERERAVERALRQPLGAASGPLRPGDCVDGETLAAWTSGALRSAEAATIERHVSDCARCQALLVTFARITPVEPVAVPWWQRWQMRWLVPLATAATAVAFWIAVPDDRDISTQEQMPESFEARQQAPAEPPPAQPPTSAAPSPPTDRFANREEVGRIDSKSGSASSESKLARRADTDTRKRRRAEDERLQERRPAAADQVAAAPPTVAEKVERDPAETRAASAYRQASAAVEIVSPSPAHRWRILPGGLVERSTDGGAAWTSVEISARDTLTAGSSPAPTVAWVVGRGGAVYVTTDGARFVRVPFVNAADLVSVAASDDRTATVMAADGRVFRTTDRGTKWTEMR